MKLWKFSTRLFWVVVLAIPFLFWGCSAHKDPWEHVEGEGPKVLALFPPLYCFAKNVGGDHAKVMCMLTTVGPHDYDPDPVDSLKAAKAQLFLVNGLGLDGFFTKITNTAQNKDLQVVKIGEILPEDVLLERSKHSHHPGQFDPHVWLGIEPAIAMVEKIRDKLVELDQENKAIYEKNAQDYIGKLKDLHQYGKKAFKDVENRQFIPTHDSLAYFSNSFGLKVPGNMMAQPGIEADAGRLADLVKVCKENKVRVLATEPQYSKSTAETLRKRLQKEMQGEGKIKLVEIDTLETVDADELDADYYIERMKKNIDNLAKALK